MQKLRRIDLACEHHGIQYTMVFAYGPDESVVYTGGINSIQNHCADMPTHHGWLLVPADPRTGREQQKRVIVLGRNGINNKLQIFKLDGRTGQLNYLHTGRTSYVLVRYNQDTGEYILIQRWRKLPKAYIRTLAKADLELDLVAVL